MRKFIIITVLALLFCSVSFIGYMLFTEKIVIRLPVLVQKNPKITFSIGDTFFRESCVTQWKMAIAGKELKPGYEVRTEENSRMDIRFHGEMALRVSEKSILKIDEMTVRKMLLNIEKGSIYGKFERLSKNYTMDVKTPTTIAGIRGTELGFEISEQEPEKNKELKKKNISKDKENPELKTTPVTTVYSLSGITELYNPHFKDQKILLSYQNRLSIEENKPPDNSEKMTEEEVSRIRSILNSIHTEEVLFISNKINFKVGSAKILPSSHEELNKIVKILQEKDVNVRIEGHTDSQASATTNQTLSVKRAKSIKEYFVKNRIDPERLEIAGYGESKPVASNETKKGRALNRRVEFIIVE